MSLLCPVAVPTDITNEPQAETATEAFLSFLEKKRLCDVTFVFDNAPEKIEAHQFCLRARSPVFDSMFRGLGSTTSTPEVKMEDASPEVFDKFLQFIYADKFDVTPVQALHLLRLGHKYKVQPLVNKCEALIGNGISTENAIELYETAEKYQLLSLKTKAGDVIARSLEDLLTSPKLMKAKDTTLIALLKRSDLTVKETDLFQLAVKWGKENSSGDQELSVALAEVLPNIRFTNMTPQELTSLVFPTKLIPPEDAVNIFAYFNGDDSMKRDISQLLKFPTSSRTVTAEPKLASAFFPNTTPGVSHRGVHCDGCEGDIEGPRFKCLTCDDYDLCRSCYAERKIHVEDAHVFVVLPSPHATSALRGANLNDHLTVEVSLSGITCDECKESVTGVRFMCAECDDYDLCEVCYLERYVHSQHLFVSAQSPAVDDLSRDSAMLQGMRLSKAMRLARWFDNESSSSDSD